MEISINKALNENFELKKIAIGRIKKNLLNSIINKKNTLFQVNIPAFNISKSIILRE